MSPAETETTAVVMWRVVVVAGGVLVVCWWYGVKEFGFDICAYILLIT